MSGSFKYYDASIEMVRQFEDGVVVPLSAPAKMAKFALDKTDHIVVSKICKPSVKYVEVDLNKVESLIRSISNQTRLLRWIIDGELDRVVVGRDLWREVVDKLVERPFAFNYETYIKPRSDLPISIYGIPVQVLPNIEGYLVLPKFNSHLTARNG
jgi:hypothetical protein